MIDSYLILVLFIFINLTILIKFSKMKIFYFNIDKPDNKRKFHSKPTPLAGGQIIFINIFLYWLIYVMTNNSFLINETLFENIKSFNYFMIISSSIFLLGLIDDKINLKANLKFIIICLIIFFLFFLDNDLIIKELKFSIYEKNFFLGRISIFFSVFCFLVYINAFNMFDGINLQSGYYSILIFLCILFFYLDSLFIKILIISLVCFSYLNFKNKTFLGDSGSLLISFIIGYVFIKLYNLNNINYADEITLYMLVPGLDLIRLFILRIFNKRNPLSSDRNHLHHLLIKKYSLKMTLLIIFSLISLPIILNFFDISNLINISVTVILYLFLLILSFKEN